MGEVWRHHRSVKSYGSPCDGSFLQQIPSDIELGLTERQQKTWDINRPVSDGLTSD